MVRWLLLLAVLGLFVSLPVDAGHTGAPYLGKRCDVDIQLVIDTSGSMGGARMDNAKLGADWFVAQMRTPEDYSGLTQFNSASTLDKSVDSNHGPKTTIGSTAYYIDQLAAGGGTTMHPAIQLAHTDLTTNGRPATSMQYMVILADGDTTDWNAAQTNAAAARASGIIIHVIQIGSNVNPTQMQNLASSPPSKYYHYAAGPNDVLGAFQDIMLEIVDCTPKVDYFQFNQSCAGTASVLGLAGNATGTVDVHQFVINWGDGQTSRVSYTSAGTVVTEPHVYANPGWYTINVTLEDTGNRAGYFEQVEYVSGCPTADFACKTNKYPYLEVLFTDWSVDPDNDLVSRKWSFGDGAGLTTQATSVKHTYPAIGWYTVRLTIEDSYGNTDWTERPCFADMNRPPVIDPHPHQIIYVGETRDLKITGHDPDGDAVAFQWSPHGTIPLNAEFDTATQLFSWAPKAGQEGTYGPTPFGICDYEFCAFMNVTWEVRAAPEANPQPNADSDGDGIPDQHDPYPADPHNGGEQGDADGDGIANGQDNCRLTPNPGQQDLDGDGIGDACDSVNDAGGPSESGTGAETGTGNDDTDGDGVSDGQDNCVSIPNPLQEDLDGDTEGDACDADVDGDRVHDFDADGTPLDNCPRIQNPNQEDADGDGLGDFCDAEPTVENPVVVDPETGHLVPEVLIETPVEIPQAASTKDVPFSWLVALVPLAFVRRR